MKKTTLLAIALLSILGVNFEANAADSDARVMEHVANFSQLARKNPGALAEERARVTQALSTARPGTPEWNQHAEKAAALDMLGH